MFIAVLIDLENNNKNKNTYEKGMAHISVKS